MNTILYIKARKTEGLYDDEINAFENYDIVRTERLTQPMAFIQANAPDFVFETFSLSAKDRKANGWVCIDDEFGEYEATENTILIPVRDMTEDEVEDKLDALATAKMDELLDCAPNFRIRQRINSNYDREWEAARDDAATGE